MHALLTSDPGGTGAPGHSALAMLPSAPDTSSAPTKRISGLNHTAYIFAVYASRRRLPERHARLASGRWPALPGRDSTRRICSEGFRNDDSSHVISSPFPELCSAHARRPFSELPNTTYGQRFPFPGFSPVQGISGARARQHDLDASISAHRRSVSFRERTRGPL